jgi:hypothetical protein
MGGTCVVGILKLVQGVCFRDQIWSDSHCVICSAWCSSDGIAGSCCTPRLNPTVVRMLHVATYIVGR